MNDNVRVDPEIASRGLHDLWSTLLKKSVGARDDFFDAGGDSLTAIRMLQRVQAEYRKELDIPTFFERPTIARLVEMLVEAPEGGWVV